MSILDQLKQEAAEKQQQLQTQVNLKQQREEQYRELILPAMQKAFNFMKELIQYLNFLEHAIIVEQYSSKYPQFGQLRQQDYKIYTDNHGGLADIDRLMQVNVRFFCVGPGAFSYNVEGQNRIEREVGFLMSRHVHFDWKLLDTRSAIPCGCFTITRKIPVRFKFAVDYDQSKIQLLINNHEDFDVYNKTFTPDAVNDELLDEIARFMLRKDSDDFIRLEIPSAHHRRHNQTLAEQQHIKDLVLMQALQSETAMPQANGKSLSERLKQLVKLPKRGPDKP